MDFLVLLETLPEPSTSESIISGLAATPSPSGTNVSLSWDSLANAELYQLKGRVFGTTTFAQLLTPNNFKIVGGLTPEETYEWIVRVRCEETLEITPFSELDAFGRVVKIQTIHSLKGKNELTLDASDLISGHYFVRIAMRK